MAALGTLPGGAATAASAPQRQRLRGAASLPAAHVPGGARLVCGWQLRAAPVLASSPLSLSGAAKRRILRAGPDAVASSGSAGPVTPAPRLRSKAPGICREIPDACHRFLLLRVVGSLTCTTNVATSKIMGNLLSVVVLTSNCHFLVKFCRYFFNVIFNILNKKILNDFPYPYFVSASHLFIGVLYCLIGWSFGFPKRAPVNSALLKQLVPVAVCHAIGHVTSTVSFAAVAVSFAHTIKALEPFVNAAASQFILGQPVPLTLWMSLVPVVVGVSVASLTELSFNWTGFINAMISNISFTYRSIYSKKAMVSPQLLFANFFPYCSPLSQTGMDSTNLYAYISIIALIVCIPPAIIIDGPKLVQYGFKDAIAKVGLAKLISNFFVVGLFYHLYNQVATNTLERVAPLSHAIGNVLKRVFVIGFSIIVFGT
ncbi:hypothetical protein HU200_053137 [Digitaria exilis]|uniref:Sugar phosphate transporter domain-containing protein n=1 Tax=Digitaria exilis TaxID=1010633 RepID=A0A835AKC8_9POAL|nr:hypothetical protein HU200_053137 [Digitaria exilis]